MKFDANNLPESPEKLKEMILSLHHNLAESQQIASEYKSKYEGILEQLSLAKQKQFSSSSEKNLLQRGLFDESGVELPDDVKDQLFDQEEQTVVAAHTRAKKPKRCKLPEDLPRETIVHDIAEADKVCACGKCLVKIGEEITEQLKYIPAQLSVVQHVRPKYACKPCQENIKIAPTPQLLLPKSIATPELIAHIVIAKYCDHLPLYRQEKMWERIAVNLPRSSLCGWVLKTAELCEPLIKQLQKSIVSYDYAQADETTVQVMQEKDRKNTSKSYMWCYRGGNKDGPMIVYEYQETRGGYHAKKFLTGFSGYLQTDAYSGYNWTATNNDIIAVGCNAHARRNFAELVKISKTPGLATQGVSFYKSLYKIEKEARADDLSSEKRHALRQEKSKPILKAFKQWLDHHLPKTSEQGKIGKAIRYCIKHWEQLTGFMKDGRVEIDNNLCENAIRPFTLGRKNWLFMGSPAGAKAGATFYSLIETCKANKIDPQQYLIQMLHKIRLCKTEEDYQALLPQNLNLDSKV